VAIDRYVVLDGIDQLRWFLVLRSGHYPGRSPCPGLWLTQELKAQTENTCGWVGGVPSIRSPVPQVQGTSGFEVCRQGFGNHWGHSLLGKENSQWETTHWLYTLQLGGSTESAFSVRELHVLRHTRYV
jgi:hypothetical protein